MYKFERIRFTNRTDADEIINRMDDIAERYGFVTVSDYKELCTISADFIDTKYGWLDHTVADAVVRRDYCGYFIDLPRPILFSDAQPETTKYEPFSCKTPADHQPIYITIHTNEISELNETLAETFKHVSQIQDRTVNLTIM